MSPLAHLLLALASATMLSAASAQMPKIPNPCNKLEIGNETMQLDLNTIEIEMILEADLTKHLVDIPNYCVGMVPGIGAMSTLKHQVVLVCHLPWVHLYALGKEIYSPVVAYCEGVNCQKHTVKVLQYCQAEPIYPPGI